MNSGVVVCVGDDAWTQLADESFVREWDQLYDKCPWATCLQSSAFVRIWFDNYRAHFYPVIVSQRGEDHFLVGLLVLAASEGQRRLVVAGAHQAEYQAWLARPEDSGDFILGALTRLDSLFPSCDLSFKYLPDGVPVRPILESKTIRRRVELKIHQRDLLQIRGDDVENSFGKKARKRLNHLKNVGELEFERIREYEIFARIFDDIIAFYDFRQGAVNGVFPFGQDEFKKAFHLDMMKRYPDLLHVTLTRLRGKPIAAHISMVSKNQVHLAIVAHSPFYAQLSPGKMHLMLLAKHLLLEGFDTLDLTPGGGYKERLASHQDVVRELVLHKSMSVRILRSLDRHSKQALKVGLKRVGVRLPRSLKRFRVQRTLSQIRQVAWAKTDYRVHTATKRLLSRTVSAGPMQKDYVPDLLKFEPTESSQTKVGFMAEAQRRLERGEHVYTYSQDGHLRCCCWYADEPRDSPLIQIWRRIPDAQIGPVLYDFQAFGPALTPAFCQQVLEQIMADILSASDVEKLHLFLRGDNRFFGRVPDRIGFQYRFSVSSLRFFGFTWQREYISSDEASD